MNAHEKTKLIDSFMQSMKTHIMDAVQYMPEEWDGIEIRQYIADKFVRQVHKMNPKRAKAFRNASAVTYGL